MNVTPRTEIADRICALQKKLADHALDGAIIVLNSDLFYFTGTVQNSILYVPAVGEAVLMVKKSLRRARVESPLVNIVPIKHPAQMQETIAAFGYTHPQKLGLSLDVLPYNLYENYRKYFPAVEFSDISILIKEIRAVKSPYEIKLISKALKVVNEAFLAVPSFLREGMTEIELAALFEAELRRRGYSGWCKMRAFNQDFFFGNVLSGNSGFVPNFFDGPVGGPGLDTARPQGAGWKKVGRDEIVYIDYTSVIEGYIGDQARMFCIGKLTDRMVKAFEDSLLIESEILKAIKVGTLAEEPYFLAVKIAQELGYGNYFMGYKEDKVKFVGHGIGVELDEWPILAKGIKTPLVPGMTFALEPKFVFPEGAIGTENSFVMTKDGPQYLSITPEVITYVK